MIKLCTVERLVNNNRCYSMYLTVILVCLIGNVYAQGPLRPIYRLPDSSFPVNYMISLNPYQHPNIVTGTVVIELNTTSNKSMVLNSITLNMGLDISVDETKVILLDSDGLVQKTGSYQYDDDNLLFKIILPDGSTLQHNHIYFLTLQFTSKLYSEPMGLFTGSYNSTSKYVASFFRPTYARNAFPCFDEPQFKVPLTLQVLRPATYTAISTAPLYSSTDPDENNMVLDTFHSTGPISIHSLGLFITEFTPVTTMGVTLYAPAGTPTDIPYIDDLLKNISNSIGEFPIEPLKLVVLPDRIFTSFASYGFVFTSPDVYEGNISGTVNWLSLKLRLTEAFLQQFLEFAKTPNWWSHLWLSESVGAFLAATFQPEPLVKDWLRIEIRSYGLGWDFRNTTGPVINNQLLSQWDIQSVIANQTIRNKGLSILSMWNDTMPTGIVLKTIHDYIKLKKPIVTTSDFLRLLEFNIRTHKTYNVTAIIDLLPFWLNTTGYPVVSYWPQSEFNFFISQSPGCPEICAWAVPVWPIWPISISFIQNNTQDWTNYKQGVWIFDTILNVTSNYSEDQWIIFNLESASYRVNYANRWYQIIAALQTESKINTTLLTIPESVKASVQDDAVALALAGCVSFSTTFKVLFSTSRNQLDWYPVAKAFDVITALIGEDEYTFSDFGVFAGTLFSQDMLNCLDLKSNCSFPNWQYVRYLMIPWLCKFNLGSCRETVVDLSEFLLQGNASMIDPSDVENVACYGFQLQRSVLSRLLTAYVNTTDPWFRHVYTIGLGCLTNQLSVQNILHEIIQPNSSISSSDASKILMGLASNIENSAVLVDFVTSQATCIQKRLGCYSLSMIIKALCKFRCDLSKLQNLNNVSLGLNPYVIQSALEAWAEAEDKESWWDSNGDRLKSALPKIPVTTLAPHSSAKSLVDLQVFSLVILAAVTAVSFSSNS